MHSCFPHYCKSTAYSTLTCDWERRVQTLLFPVADQICEIRPTRCKNVCVVDVPMDSKKLKAVVQEKLKQTRKGKIKNNAGAT
jgi:hypothetical protein